MARVYAVVDDGYISGFTAEVVIFSATSDLLPADERGIAFIYFNFVYLFCIVCVTVSR